MTYTFDENIVSDLHKDARGYRPTQAFWNAWNFQNDEGKQTAWNVLLDELNETMKRERHAENMAMIAMHQRIQGVMLLGAKDEVQALKWIMEAEEFDDHDLRYGPSYFCFHFGLSYSAEKELPIQEAINEMLSEVV
jgi:hypothetical protein